MQNQPIKTSLTDRFSKRAKQIAEEKPANAAPVMSLKQDTSNPRVTTAKAQLAEVMPALTPTHISSVADAILDIFDRKDASDRVPLTPFKSVPSVTIGDPVSIVNHLTNIGARIPTTVNPHLTNQPKDRAPSINALADCASMARGSLGSVAQKRQYLNAEQLEQLREGLVHIGKYNSLAEFEALENPVTFLQSLVDEYCDLESATPIDRVESWASMMVAGLAIDADKAKEILSASRTLSVGRYGRAVLQVWRSQYIADAMGGHPLEKFEDCDNIMSLLSTRTKSRRFNRGFQNLTAAVHRNMTDFNERLKYPTLNYSEYKRRYASHGVESGLNSESLLGYCFYTGLHPVAVLRWLAGLEVSRPGTFQAMTSNTINGLIQWSGPMSPKEYNRFIDAIMCLGIVPDSCRWSFTLLSAKYVYANIPTPKGVASLLGPTNAAFMAVGDEYFADFDYNLTVDRARGFATLIEAAAESNLVDVYNAHRDEMSLISYLCGLTLQPGTLGARITDATEAMSDEEIAEYASAHIVQSMAKIDESEFSYLVKGADGEIDHSLSCRSAKMTPREASAADNFYLGLVNQMQGSSVFEDEDADELRSLMGEWDN